jgi:hypothetical protein
MMRQIVLVLVAMSCTAATLAPLACGKYGRPQRVAQLQGPEREQVQESVGESALEPDGDDEALENRKP